MATKRERQRKLAKQAHARRQQRQADRDRRAKQLSVFAIVFVLVLGVGFGGAALAGAFSGKGKPTASSTLSTTPSATPTPTPTPTPSATPAMVGGKCVYLKSGTASRKVKLPSATPDTKASYQATIATNRGNIVISMLNKQAPCTVNSFVSLADQNFFKKTPCHRLTTAQAGIYVLQCGDPTGTGLGGPGYGFGNENLTGNFVSHISGGYAIYPPGTVAMAHSAQPDSNGSQFFLVYKNSPLPPDYTPFGTIVSGLNIIQNVAKAGSDNSSGAGDGKPKDKVEINSVTIKKT